MKYLSTLILFIFSLSTYSDIKTESLLIYGDSISAGYGMSKEKQWSVILQEKINKENLNIKIINSSISGETTSGGLVRIRQTIKSIKQDYLLLELGGNYGKDKSYIDDLDFNKKDLVDLLKDQVKDLNLSLKDQKIADEIIIESKQFWKKRGELMY